MNAIANDPDRLFNFTSSNCYRLVQMKAATKTLPEKWNESMALTYVEQVRRQRRVGRTLDNEKFATALEWGKLMEIFLFEKKLGYEYRFCSNTTEKHPDLENLYGTPDGDKYENNQIISIVEVKNPITLNSFINAAECKTIEEIRKQHDEGEKYYWQCIGNAMIRNVDYAELIFHCPKESDFKDILEVAESGIDGEIKVKWIIDAIGIGDYERFPYLKNGFDYYKDIYKFEFEVPQKDKDFLTEKILWASEKLNGEKK